ncbi:MAG: exodeoxyribonuclease V subunit gamma [Sedimentisphaerales bacterium]|nr:exodeoxyribonuclease V subunit gamma [Sedimentisphaerales bacterium]
MAVRFILGRSGTGKTSYCIKAIVDALVEVCEQQLILLVPEQATYQAERAILSDERVVGYSRLHVLSFDRLQFMLLGKSIARPAISRIGRQMIIHRILRENRNELSLFNSAADHPGLARQMADTIAELHEYAKTPDDCRQLLDELAKNERGRLTALKFADIHLVLEKYLSFIEGKFIDPDVQLARACDAVAGADFVKGARLWVDGFAGFTLAELAMLTELLKAADQSTIALCLDPTEIDLANPQTDSIDTAALFYPTLRTYADLVERIIQGKLKLAEPVILEEPVRFSACQQLAHIERTASQGEPSKIAAGESIRLISAPNERAEVRFVAQQILELVKNRGLRYRDIAVIASDIEAYQHYVEAYFADYGVPFFIDRRRPLSRHPAVGLICSALRIATAGFSSSDIFAYLKTDLVGIDRFKVDLLENFCLAFGITASDWLSDKQWQFAGADEEEFDEKHVNEVRHSVAGPLRGLKDKLCPADNQDKKISTRQFSGAVFDLLDALDVAGTIARWIEQAREKDDNAAVEEHRQFYDKLVGVFDELTEVFGETAMPAEDFMAIINSAFSQLTLAFIPPKLDQVLVGSIERSRHPDLKAVFLIGVTQRQFPIPLASSGILTDDDRNLAERADFALAGGTERNLAERRYLAYIAFTRASEYLCVTYPAVDEKGSGVPRSQLVAELEQRFDDLAENSIAGRQSGIDNVHNRAELIDLLCTQLGRDALESGQSDKADLGELLDQMRRDDEFAEAGAVVDSAIGYDNRARLDDGIIAEFFGKAIHSSATRLSSFASCPYQHFARYMLALKERKEFKFEPLDLGNFYHTALDALLKEIKARGLDFARIHDEKLREILQERIASLAAGNSFLANFARHGPHNAFILHNAGEVLEDGVLAIAQMVRAGSFEPTLSEVSFGPFQEGPDALGKCELALPDGRILSLSGKIDRLDIARLDDEETAIVFDYKRRAKSFNWTRFHHGIDMQLAIYMLAVRDASGDRTTRKVVGAFYMPVEVGAKSATIEKLPDALEKFHHKANGIFNGQFAPNLDANASKDSRFYNFYVTKDGEPYGSYDKRGALKPDDFDKVLESAKARIVRMAVEILSGRIEVSPYRIGTESPCGFCKYKPVCRFDWQINDYTPLPSLGKTEMLERMGRADG